MDNGKKRAGSALKRKVLSVLKMKRLANLKQSGFGDQPSIIVSSAYSNPMKYLTSCEAYKRWMPQSTAFSPNFMKKVVNLLCYLSLPGKNIHLANIGTSIEEFKNKLYRILGDQFDLDAKLTMFRIICAEVWQPIRTIKPIILKLLLHS